jgi:hypothetical protein
MTCRVLPVWTTHSARRNAFTDLSLQIPGTRAALQNDAMQLTTSSPGQTMCAQSVQRLGESMLAPAKANWPWRAIAAPPVGQTRLVRVSIQTLLGLSAIKPRRGS